MHFPVHTRCDIGTNFIDIHLLNYQRKILNEVANYLKPMKLNDNKCQLNCSHKQMANREMGSRC